MSRALLALALATLVLGASSASARGEAEWPDDIEALLDGWISEAEAIGAPYAERPWYPEAEAFLEQAKEAREAGRFRVALFDLETYTELALAKALLDDASNLTSEGERKTLAIERTRAWATQAREAWGALRADLHEHDGELGSVRSVERALYAADIGIVARLMLDEHARLSKELPKEPRLDEGYALALVRASHSQLLNLGWASDVLGTLGAVEGLPPRLDEAVWANVTAASLRPRAEDEQVQPMLEPYLPLEDEARENGEGILATALALAELRTQRTSGIYVIFGDATSRGKDVVADAARSMGRRLENATLEDPRGYGLEGVFTADAMDRAAYTLEFVERDQADLGLVVSAWATLDHADYVLSAVAPASPVRPASTEADAREETPLGALAPLAALAVAARFAWRRRD